MQASTADVAARTGTIATAAQLHQLQRTLPVSGRPCVHARCSPPALCCGPLLPLLSPLRTRAPPPPYTHLTLQAGAWVALVEGVCRVRVDTAVGGAVAYGGGPDGAAQEAAQLVACAHVTQLEPAAAAAPAPAPAHSSGTGAGASGSASSGSSSGEGAEVAKQAAKLRATVRQLLGRMWVGGGRRGRSCMVSW